MKKLILATVLLSAVAYGVDKSWNQNNVFYISGTTNPTSSAVNGLPGSFYLKSDGNIFFKKDSGSSTNWAALTSGLEPFTPSVSAQWNPVPTTLALAVNDLRILSSSVVGSQPVCAVGNRGLQWHVLGGAGVADIYQICEKDVSNAYVWVTH